MSGPLRVLMRLSRLAAEDPESSLKPEEVTRAMEAVKAILARGFPDKDRVYEDDTIPEWLRRLSHHYAVSTETPGSGDRLHREEVARLAHGLADVADRLVLAATLRQARGTTGFSIRELSRFSGVDHSYISRVERGAVPRPSEAVMERLAAPLGMPRWNGEAGGKPGAEPAGDGTVQRAGVDLADLGLHRPPVRSLLKVARDLTDEHLELLEAQARAMRERVRKKRA